MHIGWMLTLMEKHDLLKGPAMSDAYNDGYERWEEGCDPKFDGPGM